MWSHGDLTFVIVKRNSKENSAENSSENSAERSAERSAESSVENVNCLFDLYNAHANLKLFDILSAANFNPVQKAKKLEMESAGGTRFFKNLKISQKLWKN